MLLSHWYRVHMLYVTVNEQRNQIIFWWLAMHCPIHSFRSKKSKKSDERPPTPVYEIPNVTALPDPSLCLQYNTAYGMTGPQQMELADNISYGVIQWVYFITHLCSLA